MDYMLYAVEPGSMNSQTFGIARNLVIQLGREKRNPALAERMLERLEAEVDANDEHRLSASLYGVCIDAWGKSGDARAGEKAEALFEKMQARNDLDPERSPAANDVIYHNVMHAWATSTNTHAPEKVKILLNQMNEKSNADPAVRPTESTYNLLIMAYANRIGEYGAAKAAEDVLYRLSELHTEGIRPDTRSFNLVLKAWANSMEDMGPDRALEILRLMIKLHQGGHDNVVPNEVSFSTVIHAFAIQGKVEEAEKVLHMTDEVNFHPRVKLTSCFNATIDAYAKSGRPDAGRQAESLLQHGLVTGKLVPDQITYGACLDAHVASDSPAAPENAEAFLRAMIDSYESGDIRVRPETHFFKRVVKAWVRSRREEAAMKADALLMFMENLATKNQSFRHLGQPDSHMYTMCIDAWCLKGSAESRSRALFLLERLEQAYADGSAATGPTTFSYRRVICILARSREQSDVRKAFDVLRRMEMKGQLRSLDRPLDARPYNSVVAGLARTSKADAVYQAADLLQRMEDLYSKGNDMMAPDSRTYVAVIYGLRRLNNPKSLAAAFRLFDRMRELETDPSRVIQVDKRLSRDIFFSLSQIKGRWAAEKAMEIFAWLENRFETKGIHYDPVCLDACVEVASKCRDVALLNTVQELLERQVSKHVEGRSPWLPTREVFHTMIRAWSKMPTNESKNRVLAILNSMKQLSANGMVGLEPTCATYTEIVRVLAQTRSANVARVAEALVLSLEEGSRENESQSRPDIVLWNSVLHAWSRADSTDKAKEAKRVLDSINARFRHGQSTCQPDIFSYNTVLNAVAFTSEGDTETKEEAFQVAESTFQELKASPHFSPDDITYGTMIKSCRHLLEDEAERLRRIHALVYECYSEGKVGELVSKELQATDDLKTLAGSLGIKLNSR
jgi:pentatricopeptide repeat protein